MNIFNLYFLPAIFLVLLIAVGCTDDPSEADSQDMSYNSELAEQLGADNLGMKRYVLAILKSGPNRPENPDEAADLQRAHMQNINRLADEGYLVLAGPFIEGGEMRGLYLFDVESIEEARKLTESDPAIQAGSLRMELYSWYGSAAILKVNEFHRQISRDNL